MKLSKLLKIKDKVRLPTSHPILPMADSVVGFYSF